MYFKGVSIIIFSSMHKRNHLQAFTIVELLIVIVVIAILASISIVSYTGIQGRAAATVLQSDLRNAATQLTLDYTYNGTYPGSAAAANEGKGLTKSSSTTYNYKAMVQVTACLPHPAGLE